jgi:hypothetical protein
VLLDAPRRAEKCTAGMTTVVADEHLPTIAKAHGHVALLARDGWALLPRECDLDVLDGGFVTPEREACSTRERCFCLPVES